MITAGCRISKVIMKDGGAIVSVLPGPRDRASDQTVIGNLLWALEHARRENVLAYAIMLMLERPDGSTHYLKTVAIKQSDGSGLHDVLGGVEMLADTVRLSIREANAA